MINPFSKIAHLCKGASVSIDSKFYQRKYILQQSILSNSDSGITNFRYMPDHDVIVSLTTYGKRIYDIALTIESIMQQTMKANRIVLWLDYSFEKKHLPASLLRLVDRGLEIAFCKDIRSYKKLIPALCEFPDDAILTIDDDVLYEYDVLEHLITAYQQDQKFIYCHRFHKMLSDGKGKLLPYKRWEWENSSMDPDIMNFPTGVGGVLYPPHSLDEEVTNESVFMEICKFADDVWFKAMAMKKGTLSSAVYSHNYKGDFIENPEVRDMALYRTNTMSKNMNDIQIDAVFSKYGLYQLIV